MKTIVINHKMYEIKTSTICTNCMFYNNKTGEQTCDEEQSVKCFINDFIFIREIKTYRDESQ